MEARDWEKEKPQRMESSMTRLTPFAKGVSLIRPEVKEYATEDVLEGHQGELIAWCNYCEQEAIEVVDEIIRKYCK